MTPTTNDVEPTTSASDEVRHLLDERGVEWRRTPHYSSGSIDNETVFAGNGIEWYANDHLNGRLGLRAARYEVTPEQAIEATLGRGECHADEVDSYECVCDGIGRYGQHVTVHVMECSACGGTYEHINGGYEFCPRCRAKVVDE